MPTADNLRNNMVDFNLIAVSILKEAAINTPQTLGATMAVDKGNVLAVKPNLQVDEKTARGSEEAGEFFLLSSRGEFNLSFPMLQAQHIAFGAGFYYGDVSSSAHGTGRKHAITPMSSNIQPGFTAAGRSGKDINKRRLASCYIDNLNLKFPRGDWAAMDLGVKTTGKYEDSVIEETITAAYNATSLTLAANGVQGSTADERLANVQAVYAVDPSNGKHVYVDPSAVSGATPAVITIPAPGGVATSTTFYVLYVPTEAGWCSFPAKVTESPLRVNDLAIIIDGKYVGGDIVGGYSIDKDIKSLTFTGQNGMIIEDRCASGSSGDYANSALRGGRVQVIKLEKDLRNWILENLMWKKRTFGVKISLLGAEWESGKRYGATAMFPLCGLVDKTITAGDKVLAEAGDLRVLDDGTNMTAYWEVYNKVTTYVG